VPGGMGMCSTAVCEQPTRSKQEEPARPQQSGYTATPPSGHRDLSVGSLPPSLLLMSGWLAAAAAPPPCAAAPVQAADDARVRLRFAGRGGSGAGLERARKGRGVRGIAAATCGAPIAPHTRRPALALLTLELGAFRPATALPLLLLLRIAPPFPCCCCWAGAFFLLILKEFKDL
jgi:hypothetical protein